MIIEVKNVSDVNQGAHLMLRTIMAWRDNVLPHAKIAVDMRSLREETRKRYGLKLLTWSYFKSTAVTGRVTNALSALIPCMLREKQALVRDHEIEVVLDAAGFMYSDQWGPAGAERMVLDMRRRQSRGVKYIFLPQAFGPFRSDRTISAMREIGRRADLIYARDRASLEYLREIGIDGPNIRQCPDVTFSLDAPEPVTALPGTAAIIPNKRMQDKTSANESARYLGFLENAVRQLSGQGFQPFFLIHEAGDLEIAHQVNAQIGSSIPILVEEDPVQLKSLVGAAELVVGSRFHGLVNALSQAVPAVAVGWSHKYEMLFNDMGVPDHILRLEEFSAFDRLIRKMALPSERHLVHRHLAEKGRQMRVHCSQMWDQVLGCIQ